MRNFMRLALALALLVGMAVNPTAPNAWSSNASAKSETAFEDFDIRLALHQNERMFVASFMDGEPHQLAMVDIFITANVAGSLISFHSFEFVRLNEVGQASIYVPIEYEPIHTNFEATVTGSFMGLDGTVHLANTDWGFGSKLMTDFQDLALISPTAYESLSTSMSVATSSVSSSPPPPQGDASFAFTSQNTNPDGSFQASGAGNYLATAPLASFATVSGPAGIFTAN